MKNLRLHNNSIHRNIKICKKELSQNPGVFLLDVEELMFLIIILYDQTLSKIDLFIEN